MDCLFDNVMELMARVGEKISLQQLVKTQLFSYLSDNKNKNECFFRDRRKNKTNKESQRNKKI